MTTTATTANHLATVKAIGAALRRSETAVPEIVASLPEGFDPSKRGAVTDAIHSWACGDAERPAVKVGPKGAQRATDYGRGVDALTKAVKAALKGDEATTPDYLALAVQAARTAYTKGEKTPAAIMEAINTALGEAATEDKSATVTTLSAVS